MIQQSISTANDKQGNGRYTPMRKRNKNSEVVDEQSQEFCYLDKTDVRMRFNTSRDPIYFAFDFIERRSLPALAGDFVKDSFTEIANFISKVVK